MKFKRAVLDESAAKKTVNLLQGCLFDLTDLALQGKQAHWNVVGANFRPVHLQLDEIIESAREASDEVAERISTLGISADGRSASIAKHSRLEVFPDGFHSASTTVTTFSDRLAKAIGGMREAIDALAEVDPVSQDLLIGVTAGLEKHLWMLQTQEVNG